eukprot:488505-Amphidinium_carterae.1
MDTTPLTMLHCPSPCQRLAVPFPCQAVILKDEQGQIYWTHDAMHDTLIHDWGQYYDLDSRRQFDECTIVEAFSEIIPEGVAPELAPIDAALLWEVVRDASRASSAGPDGIWPAELKDLPMRAFEGLARIFDLIERNQRWPEATTYARVTILNKKPDKHEVLQQRLISVTSAYYRLWAASSFRQLQPWLDNHIDPNITGGLRGRSVSHSLWRVALDLETAQLRGESIFGTSIDLTKCFDTLSRPAWARMARRLGIPVNVITPMLQFYEQSHRFFCIDGT